MKADARARAAASPVLLCCRNQTCGALVCAHGSQNQALHLNRPMPSSFQPLRRAYCAKLAHYRKRVWTCKATQAGELTYEEALCSEAAGSKAAPAVRSVKASALSLQAVTPGHLAVRSSLVTPRQAGPSSQPERRLPMCKHSALTPSLLTRLGASAASAPAPVLRAAPLRRSLPAAAGEPTRRGRAGARVLQGPGAAARALCHGAPG